MKLNKENWMEFRLGDYFDVKKGKRLTSEEQTDGTTPYIGAIDSNNGLANKIGQNPIHEGNTISLSYNGSVGEAFYQPTAYWATDDVNALYFKEENEYEFNEYVGMFIATILKQERYKFSYGRKWVVKAMENALIKLPSTEDNKPDWAFMEDYIKSIHHKPITTKNKKNQCPKLDVSSWKEFCIDDLFEVSAGNYYYSDEYEVGNTPYVSASDTNNGILEKINITPDFEPNVITIGKVGATTYYQSEKFCATSDVNILDPKFEMNKYIGLFLTTIINFSENYKWSYGRQCRIGDTKKIIIQIPVQLNENDEPIIDADKTFHPQGFIPDWELMEKYVKMLLYGDRV